MENNKIFLASNLKFLRVRKGLTQKQVADKLNKTDVAILYWENGKREPNAVDLGNLSILFNVSVSDLLLKDLRLENNEFDNYLDANKHLLTDEDKDMIKFLIEKRKTK